MDFRPLTVNDAEAIRPFFQNLRSRTCDLTLGCMLMWSDFYRQEYAVFEDILFVAYYDENGEKYYALPIGEDDSKILKGIDLLCRYEEEKGKVGKAKFCAIPKEYLPLFEKMQRSFTPLPQVDFFDYLYAADDMKLLKGKKFNGQRNHINKFRKTATEWHLEEIGPDNIKDAEEFLRNTYKKADGNISAEDAYNSSEENAMVLDVLKNYAIYGFCGAILYADGVPVGFSIGEILGDTLFVHIEKADRNYPGAYQMLVNQFALKFASEDINFINREDDMGDEGLRKSKLSYHPIEILEKFTLEELKSNN